MKSLSNYFNYLLDFLYRAVRLVGAVMLAAIIGLTSYDVFMRYTFHKAILGSNEMVQFMLGIMVFAGFVMVTAHRSHIVVSIFEPFMTRHTPGLYKGLVRGFNLFGIIVITYIVIKYTAFQHKFQSATDIHEFEYWKLGVSFAVLAAIGIPFGIKALWWPRRKGYYVPPKDVVIARAKPMSVDLVEGQKYAWCACGLSSKQPFCDGSHKTTDIKPVVFEAELGGLTSMCACKMSDNAPYCNGRHNDLSGAPEHFDAV